MRTLSNKELVELRKFASASIVEEIDGTFTMSPKDTSSIYLSILALNKKSISKDSNFDLPNQNGDFYTFNTSMINDFIEKHKPFGFKFADNIKQGQAGNISLAFLTNTRDNKIINQDMFNIISKSEIKIVLLKDSDKFILDINSLEDWNDFVNNKIKDFTPLRLFIKNVSFPECNCFYLKPLNAYFNQIYKSLIDNFSKKNCLLELKSKEIREVFGFNISEYINNVSNNNFLVKVEEYKVSKIYLIEKTHLYFPYEIDDIHNYDNFSFIKKNYSLIKEDEIFERLDILDLYSDFYKNKNVEKLTFFNRNETKNIHNTILNNIKTSEDVILNKSDELIISKLSKHDGEIFEVTLNKMNKHNIRIKRKSDSDIEVVLYDRSYNSQDNIDNQVTWFTTINEGLSFEREKVLSIFYIEEFVENLKKIGHSNIRIELEKPINKKDGRKGFLDFFITSDSNDRKYGQVFEFKAIYRYTDSVKETCIKQSLSYDITSNIIDIQNLQESYEGLDYNEVQLLNLI